VSEKLHKGKIENWRKSPCESGLGYFITGKFVGHPSLHGEYGHTSFVVAHDEATGEIETNNSRYTLGRESAAYAPTVTSENEHILKMLRAFIAQIEATPLVSGEAYEQLRRHRTDKFAVTVRVECYPLESDQVTF
jgi:hypothetical protein